MKVEGFLIARGNSTLLVEDCPINEWNRIAKEGLQKVEQVGFIATDVPIPTLTMMGGELSINGTLAFAKQLGGSGQLQTSGLSSLVDYENRNGTTSIRINMPYKTDRSILATKDDVVLFEGIGYWCTNKQSPTMGELVTLAEKYKLPAFGIVTYISDTISPFVYVVQTESMKAETACGSGSIAMNILTGQERIMQRTSKPIFVHRNGNRFTISAKVDIMR